MSTTPFFHISSEDATTVASQFGSPAFVYDQATLEALAKQVVNFSAPFGLTPRFAMKACPTKAVLQIFSNAGLHIDASSGYEADRAIAAGIPASHIQITAQELPENLEELVRKGVLFNACSLHQLKTYAALRPNSEVSIRVNPGTGSGETNRTNTGGVSSSFGIWHEYVDQALAVAKESGVTISGLHSHIGAGTDPEVWVHCLELTLGVVENLPDINRVSLGGGFKVDRLAPENSSNMQKIGQRVSALLESFFEKTGRKLHFELEPGTFLVANAASLVSKVIDVVDTGSGGYRFIKINSGMTEILRPSMYGAQHPIEVISKSGSSSKDSFIVVGHCCESGDILTPAPGDPEGLAPRELVEPEIGDLVLIHGAGAYCSAMAAVNYNSFPMATEILRQSDGSFRVIRKRQEVEQVVQNEC